eukprot:TRINITY_DN2535_c0_g1_i1.p1 TRINITY_DN2535_c0_g1~~TRINITY_DN2535_c0_g1_i1.p1  ORF type:complete len:235 (+),score=21.95 TRINITY_DN2535_c0_g1_i1:188-892(+)
MHGSTSSPSKFRLFWKENKMDLLLFSFGIFMLILSFVAPAAIKNSVNEGKGHTGELITLNFDETHDIQSTANYTEFNLYRVYVNTEATLHAHLLNSTQVSVYIKAGSPPSLSDDGQEEVLRFNDSSLPDNYNLDTCSATNYYFGVISDGDSSAPFLLRLTLLKKKGDCEVDYFGGPMMEVLLFVIPLLIGILLLAFSTIHFVLKRLRGNKPPQGRFRKEYKNLFSEDVNDNENL